MEKKPLEMETQVELKGQRAHTTSATRWNQGEDEAKDAGRTKFDQGEAGGMWEPGAAVRTMVSGGAERWGS